MVISGEKEAVNKAMKEAKQLDIVEEKAPLKSNVTIREVGDAVSFLFSPMSKAITGQVIYADNGYSIMG